MDYLYTVYYIYPDTGPVKFLLLMLVVIAFAIWWGMREDKK